MSKQKEAVEAVNEYNGVEYRGSKLKFILLKNQIRPVSAGSSGRKRKLNQAKSPAETARKVRRSTQSENSKRLSREEVATKRSVTFNDGDNKEEEDEDVVFQITNFKGVQDELEDFESKKPGNKREPRLLISQSGKKSLTFKKGKEKKEIKISQNPQRRKKAISIKPKGKQMSIHIKKKPSAGRRSISLKADKKNLKKHRFVVKN